MKKLLRTLGLIAILTPLVGEAQVVIERPDVSYPGQTFQFHTDTGYVLPAGFNSPGTGKRWDFSNAVNSSSFSTIYMEPNASNGGDTVANCNLVIKDNDNYEEYSYLNATDSGLYLLGQNFDFNGMNPEFEPRMIIFPLAINAAWVDSLVTDTVMTGADAGFPVFDSVRLEVRFSISNFADAEGMLLLPSDSSESIRLRSIVKYNLIGSGYTSITGWNQLYADNSTDTNWVFMNKKGGHFGANLTDLSNGKGKLEYRSASLVNVKRVSENSSLQVYPNPTQQVLNLTADQNGTLNIYDMQGKLVKKDLRINEGNNSIQTDFLVTGRYIAVIQYQDGTYSSVKIVKN